MKLKSTTSTTGSLMQRFYLMAGGTLILNIIARVHAAWKPTESQRPQDKTPYALSSTNFSLGYCSSFHMAAVAGWSTGIDNRHVGKSRRRSINWSCWSLDQNVFT